MKGPPVTIRLIPDLPPHIVGFEAIGEVTSADYTEVLEPAVTAASEATDGKIDLLYVLGDDFTGYSGSAMWEDGKMGTEYLTKWERIAVVTDTSWVRHSVGLFGHLMPGRIKVFPVAERAAATDWVSTAD